MPLDDAPGGTAHYEKMSPSLLAAQPPTEADAEFRKSPTWWRPLYNHLEKRYRALRTWRWSWWRHWGVLAEFFLPRRWAWLVVPNRMWKGNPLNDQIIDSAPLQAARTCAAGLWSGLTSPSRPWFKLGLALPWVSVDADIKRYLEQVEERLYVVLHQSNFYNTTAQMFEDVVVFGTSPMVIYEDAEDVIRCYLPCAGEYYLATGARFTVDTLNREFAMTVAQIVEFAGLDKCPMEVKKLWDDDTTESELVVLHSVEPNFAIKGKNDKSGKSPVPGRFTFRETYWLRGKTSEVPLSIRGFHEKPFVVARWSVSSNDAYGRSPAMDCLGDAKQIQLEQLRKAEFIEKGVRPPMGADPDMKNEPASIIPAHITYVNTAGGKKGFWPLFEPNAQWLVGLVADIKEVTERINRCMFVDIFMAISRMDGVQPRNELELTKRDLERLQVLGPFIERFEQEFASPALARVLAIMERRGLLPPPPPSMQGVPLKIQYQSIMRMAQKSAESIAMKDGFVTMGQVSLAAKNAGVPDPMRVVDLDKSLKHYLRINDYPMSCLFTKEEVEDHDKIRMEEQQRAKQEAVASRLSKPAVDAAKVLSQTQVPGGNALSSLLTGNTAQP